MGQGLVIGEVVDADDLDIGAGVGYRTEETPSDPAESVDSDTNGHNVLLLARFAHGLVRAVFTGMLPVNATPARHAMPRGRTRAGTGQMSSISCVRLASVSGTPSS